jgi:seryl-tRNA synthetase
MDNIRQNQETLIRNNYNARETESVQDRLEELDKKYQALNKRLQFHIYSHNYLEDSVESLKEDRITLVTRHSSEGEKFDTDISAFEHELEKFQNLLPDLMKTHLYQFVAILNGTVVDHDEDEFRLVKRLYRKYPNDYVLIREVKKEPPVIFALESPEGVEGD